MEHWQEAFDAFLDRVAGPLPTGEEVPDEGIQGRALVVQDDRMADRMVRRMAHLEHEIVARDQHLEARIAEIDQFVLESLEPDRRWQTDEDAKAQRHLMALEGLLRSYLTHLRDLGKLGKARGYALPSGRLQFSTVDADFEVTDDAAFVAWATPLGLVEMVPKIRWHAAKHWMHPDENRVGAAVYVEYLDDATGEVIHAPVPGVQVTRPRGETFRVQHRKGGADGL